MNANTIRRHIFDFIKINRQYPVFMAITVQQFQEYKASCYFPGIKSGLNLDDFKSYGIIFHYRWKGKSRQITIIWKESVIV